MTKTDSRSKRLFAIFLLLLVDLASSFTIIRPTTTHVTRLDQIEKPLRQYPDEEIPFEGLLQYDQDPRPLFRQRPVLTLERTDLNYTDEDRTWAVIQLVYCLSFPVGLRLFMSMFRTTARVGRNGALPVLFFLFFD